MTALDGYLRPKATNPLDGILVLGPLVGSGDTTPPIITVNSVSRTKVSNQPGANMVTVEFVTNEAVTAYELRHIAAETTPRTSGYVIVSGGAQPTGSTISVSFSTADLNNAFPDEGPNVIRVYGRDAAGNWSN